MSPRDKLGTSGGRCLRGVPFYSVKHTKGRCRIYTTVLFDHTHSDALISVMNTPSGVGRVGEMYGDRVVIVPYVMPGFKLVRSSLKVFSAQATSRTSWSGKASAASNRGGCTAI